MRTGIQEPESTKALTSSLFFSTRFLTSSVSPLAIARERALQTEAGISFGIAIIPIRYKIKQAGTRKNLVPPGRQVGPKAPEFGRGWSSERYLADDELGLGESPVVFAGEIQ